MEREWNVIMDESDRQGGTDRMSYADQIFKEMCRDIIENGTSTEGEKVRTKWEDGTSAYTIKRFGVVTRYLRAVWTRFSGFIRRSLIIFMI